MDLSKKRHDMQLSPEQLLQHLAGMGIVATTVRHPPLYTVADSQALRGEIPGAHTKNLFLKDKKDDFFLLTVGEEAVVDLKQIHHVIGASGRVSFGKPEKLLELLGVQPGSVTAFGIVNDVNCRVKLILDETLMENEVINAHPLTNGATTSIHRDDLVRFIESTGHQAHVLKLTA